MDEKQLVTAVDQWVVQHRDELVQDIIRLVNIRSVSDPGEGGYAMGTGCKKCLDTFLGLGKQYGFETENDEDYCGSVIWRGKSDRELAFLGHVDVVPEGEGWKYDPYQAFESQGFIVGRGSMDNKGPTTACLYTLRCLKDLGVRLDHTVRVIAGTNEESGMKDVEHYLSKHTPPDWTLVCDTSWIACVGEMGIVNAELVQTGGWSNLLELQGGIAPNSVPDSATARLSGLSQEQVAALQGLPSITAVQENGVTTIRAAGKAGHAAFPQGGDNAIYRLLDCLCSQNLVAGEAGEKIRALRACFTDDFGTGLGIAFEDQVSGRTVCTGGVISLKEGRLVQTINVRSAITQDPEQLADALRKTCQSRGIAVENLEFNPGRYISPDDPVVKILVDTANKYLQDEPNGGVYVMAGGTHARKLPNALPYGCNLRKANSPFGFSHGPNEAAYIQAFLLGIRIYAEALTKLDRALPVEQ